MLTDLRVRDLAVIADVSLHLEPGLNVLTGETGRELRGVAVRLYEKVVDTTEEQIPEVKVAKRKVKTAVRKTKARARKVAA